MLFGQDGDHGSPLARTWVKLGSNVKPGDDQLNLADAVDGWRVGDEVIVTASKRPGTGSYRPGARRSAQAQTESRHIESIDGSTLRLDKPLEFEHFGMGEFRSEVANLSRNVVVESADPQGVRGHTVYHRFSKGGISYARFAHLGKEGVLGRYAIHYHLVGDTMRGSSVRGVAIVDSHNRWVTIHGTQYLVVRDCVGYQSVGHGFFLEDGTEIYNLLDRNLGVQSKQLIGDGNKYREERPLTGDESRVAEVADVTWPALLDPVDDVPPATIITSVKRDGEKLVVRGVAHDDGTIVSVVVNDCQAKIISTGAGVVDWEVSLSEPSAGTILAFATDAAGNAERTPHRL